MSPFSPHQQNTKNMCGSCAVRAVSQKQKQRKRHQTETTRQCAVSVQFFSQKSAKIAIYSFYAVSRGSR